MRKRMKLKIVPPLGEVDRKALSGYVQMLRFHKPNRILLGTTFGFRGSVVTLSYT